MNLIILKIFIDYLKNIKNIKNKIFSFCDSFFFKYISDKNNLKKIGIKKILTFSKNFEKIANKNKINLIKNNFRPDYYICFCKNIKNNYFTKCHKGNISEQKILYYKSKKVIILTNKIIKKNEYIPVEIINSLRNYIFKNLKLLNLKFKLKKKKKKIFYTKNNFNILLIKNILNYNLYLFEKKLLNIFGIINLGIFYFRKNTKILLINKRKIILL
ncbi:ribose-5-phosphate isomerase A [Candidatus Vidania fulgoroideorum]